MWASYGFAQGYAGLAVLWGQLDRCFPREGWDAVAHEHLEIAAHGAVTEMHLMPSAFASLHGLAFAAWYLSRSGTRYRRLIATLEESSRSQTQADDRGRESPARRRTGEHVRRNLGFERRRSLSAKPSRVGGCVAGGREHPRRVDPVPC